MLYDHPQDAAIIGGDGFSTLHYNDWFAKSKEQVNRGEQPASIQSIKASVGVRLSSPVNHLLIRIEGETTGTTEISSNPKIEFGFDGQKITLEGNDETKKVKLTNGNGIKLAGGANFTLGEYDNISFHYSQVKKLWIETTRSHH